MRLSDPGRHAIGALTAYGAADHSFARLQCNVWVSIWWLVQFPAKGITWEECRQSDEGRVKHQSGTPRRSASPSLSTSNHPTLLSNISAAPLLAGPPYIRTESTDQPRVRKGEIAFKYPAKRRRRRRMTDSSMSSRCA